MKVRFKVHETKATESDKTVSMRPVAGDENKVAWGKNTPGGVIKLDAVGAQAAKLFKPGAVFEVEFKLVK